MNDRAFVFTSNGGEMTWDLDDDFRPYDDQIHRTLSLLGDGKSTLLFWALPEGDDALMNSDAEPTDAEEYLQCAGTAEQMTIEIQRREPDGVLRHYIVGRTPPVPGEPELEVFWADGEFHTTITESEAFDADSAAPVFQYYFRHRDVAAGTPLRLLPEFRG